MRQEGYYWVKGEANGKWKPLYFDGSVWLYENSADNFDMPPLLDIGLHEINENRIPEPGEAGAAFDSSNADPYKILSEGRDFLRDKTTYIPITSGILNRIDFQIQGYQLPVITDEHKSIIDRGTEANTGIASTMSKYAGREMYYSTAELQSPHPIFEYVATIHMSKIGEFHYIYVKK